MNTPDLLQARMPLRKLSAGEYETEDGSVRIKEVTRHSWAAIANGKVIPVLGILEFTTLREVQGKLADAADLIRERKAA